VRRFEDELERALSRVRPVTPPRVVTVVTGALYGPRLARLLEPLAPHGVAAQVVAVPNDFFGRTISVAGLLTGQDIQRHLAGLERLGTEVLVPAAAIRDGDGVFLDDVTPADLARDLGVPVRVVEPTARALLRALRGP
jgi:NifB/MoaA-like Fe-S oxidoreductase